jgi:hypothetical protein
VKFWQGNADEPGHPLITDVTEAGLVTPEGGFEHEELLHYDPWGGLELGEAGVVADARSTRPASPSR